MPMQKYKRPRKPGGIRSIPLSNPRKVSWHTNWDKYRLEGAKPMPVAEPTDDCFTAAPSRVPLLLDDDPWLAKKLPPEPPPRFVLMHSLDSYVEIRMYWLGSMYWFVERNTLTKLEWKSMTYSSKERAKKAYGLYMNRVQNAIVWKSKKSIYSAGRD